MKKQSLAEKMAEKAFRAPQFQQSWNVHLQAFGPILEPAFDSFQMKTHICAALNLISSGKIQQGIKKLQSVQDKCETDADRAAWLFFMGVACEMAGQTDQMYVFYSYAGEYGHRFFMPYVKCGKYALNCGDYIAAEQDYRAAIACFDGKGLSGRDKLILGSAYTNLATCLTMTRRFEEAEAALATSRSLCPQADGRPAAEAILYAVQGRTAECEEALAKLTPQARKVIEETVNPILSGSNPRFTVRPAAEERIADFWAWFAGHAEELAEILEGENKQAAVESMGSHLAELFDFLEDTPHLGIGCEDGRFTVELMDNFHASLEAGCEALLAARPAGHENWAFTVIHSI